MSPPGSLNPSVVGERFVRKQLSTFFQTAAVAAAVLALGPVTAEAGRAGYRTSYTVYRGYGPRPGYYGYYGPRGYYPYYGGYGLGVGVYWPYGYYRPYGYGPYPTVVVSNNNYYSLPPSAGDDPAAKGAPPVDNAAHLKLIVPADAQVWFDGRKTTQAGTERVFTSPPLPPGKRYTYRVRVLWTDDRGKAHDETRALHVRADDWFLIDFTRPAPPEDLPAPLPPAEPR